MVLGPYWMINTTDSVMVMRPASRAVGRRFDPRPGHTRDSKIGIRSYPARRSAITDSMEEKKKTD